MVLNRKLFVQSLFFGLLGLALLYLSFRKVEFSDIIQIIAEGDHLVMVPVFLVSVLVYAARVKRWQMLFKTIQIQAPARYLFASLATGYLVNFAIPRLGEISRALLLKKALKYPVNASLSTVVFERATDVFCLGVIVLMAFLFEFINKGSLLYTFTRDVDFFTPVKLGLFSGFCLLGYLLYRWLRTRKDQVSVWIKQLLQNLRQIIRMPDKKIFVGYTLVIWLGFFLMTYLWFFMFKESAKLTLYDAFLVMTLGVVARSLPIQAGSAGAYHFVVSQALLFMGIGLVTSNALAIVIHGFQTILTIALGISSYIWLLLKSEKQVV